jgi:hypothetical protein
MGSSMIAKRMKTVVVILVTMKHLLAAKSPFPLVLLSFALRELWPCLIPPSALLHDSPGIALNLLCESLIVVLSDSVSA